ncbi:MAG: nuclear transport factor 2 family protein [Proteobacteria bacterium]|nr:nuclear transport factor 2 family protein [Pseudomonadota bacterium]
MNSVNKGVALAFVGAFAGSALVTQVSAAESARIEQLEHQRNEAQQNNNVAWFEKHLAEGYVEGHSWGEWASRADAIKQTREKANKIAKGEISDMKVATYGANVAVARYKFTYDGTFGATHRARTVICSNTWVEEGGAWKLASNHCSHVEGT